MLVHVHKTSFYSVLNNYALLVCHMLQLRTSLLNDLEVEVKIQSMWPIKFTFAWFWQSFESVQ